MAGIFRLDAARCRRAGVPDARRYRRRIADAADQARDAPAAFIHADGEHLDAVAVHQRCGIGARQHQRRRAVVRHHQHIAVGAAAHPAGDALALARRGKAVRALDGLAVAHHGGKPFGERVALCARLQAQALGEPRSRQRLRRLRQMLEQQFAAGDRVCVARLLEF